MNIEKNIINLTENNSNRLAENRASNYDLITLSHKKSLKYIQIRLA